MACYHPMTAYRARSGRTKSGSWPITFSTNEGYRDLPVTLPCGRCIGCRLEKSRQWAIRCMQESEMHDTNSFITLTYNSKNYPEDGSLSKDTIQLFIKRLRDKIDKRIRYFLCGEYGENFNRPHYHACIFGYDFPDKKLITISNGGHLIYGESELLQNTWPFGFHSIGKLTFESAAYVARYCTKKITGKGNEQEIWYDGRLPEFALMSTGKNKNEINGGLGKRWIEKYANDVLSTDKIIIRKNLQCRPPVYYNNIMDKIDHETYQKNKQERRKKIDEKTPERLNVLEKAKAIKFKKLKRSYENGNENLCNA